MWTTTGVSDPGSTCGPKTVDRRLKTDYSCKVKNAVRDSSRPLLATRIISS